MSLSDEVVLGVASGAVDAFGVGDDVAGGVGEREDRCEPAVLLSVGVGGFHRVARADRVIRGGEHTADQFQYRQVWSRLAKPGRGQVDEFLAVPEVAEKCPE